MWPTFWSWLLRPLIAAASPISLLLQALVTRLLGISSQRSRCEQPNSWESLLEAAGSQSERLFYDQLRLFGDSNAIPRMRLWRDREGWCPFCMMIVLLLEAMEIPYEVRKLPLSKYLRKGETKPIEYTKMVPEGLVPGLQLSSALLEGNDHASNSPSVYFPPLLNAYHIFELLLEQFPERYPMGDAAKHAAVCEGDNGLAHRLQTALYALAFRPDEETALQAFHAVLEELHKLIDVGPFINGAEPSAADFQLLPWLERAEAYLPHVLGEEFLASACWQRAAALLDKARSAVATFSDIAADAESLVADAAKLKAVRTTTGADSVRQHVSSGDTRASRVQPPPLSRLPLSCPLSERRAAAAQLAANHTKVGEFSRRKARLRPIVAPSPTSDALDDALKAVVRQLMAERPLDPRIASLATADAIRIRCGAEASTEAALALTALAANVAVPRDLRRGAACTFRAHCRELADALGDETRPVSSL